MTLSSLSNSTRTSVVVTPHQVLPIPQQSNCGNKDTSVRQLPAGCSRRYLMPHKTAAINFKKSSNRDNIDPRAPQMDLQEFLNMQTLPS